MDLLRVYGFPINLSWSDYSRSIKCTKTERKKSHPFDDATLRTWWCAVKCTVCPHESLCAHKRIVKKLINYFTCDYYGNMKDCQSYDTVAYMKLWSTPYSCKYFEKFCVLIVWPIILTYHILNNAVSTVVSISSI